MEMPHLVLIGIGIIVCIVWAEARAEKKKTEQAKELQEQKRLQEEQKREEEEKQAAERRRIILEENYKRREEEARRKAEEIQRKREERYAAYDKMISSIEPYSVSISEGKAPKQSVSVVNDLTFSTITTRTDMAKLGNFVVLDTETTGLKCSSDEIIDIAAIRFRNFQPVAKFSMLLAPKKPIPERITAINHITDEMVEGCPCFQQVALSLVEFIGDDNIVGHNLPFDLKFIVHYGADVTTKKRKYYDTLAISQKTIKKVKMKWDKELEAYFEDDNSDGISNYKLETLCSYLDIINMDAHRAESDALATGILFHKLAEIRKG